ncbi:hypothetical protein Scep_026098 [Stephania cephalantha]|uniref:Uncharacterized protein n=1 Tax=Stephania cephalantha TaxID=152367 RepID=A0AAP0ETD8_9MAGN
MAVTTRKFDLCHVSGQGRLWDPLVEMRMSESRVEMLIVEKSICGECGEPKHERGTRLESRADRGGKKEIGKRDDREGESTAAVTTGDGREQRSAAVGQGGCVARRRSDGGQGGCAAARRWRTATAEVGSGGDRTSGSVAVQRELMAGDVDAGEGLDGRQRRGSSDAGSGVARQRRRREGSDERVRSAAKARECGAGERPAAASARQRQRRGERRGGALSTGRMRDFDEIATTRWRDLGVGCRVRKSRRERDVLRFAISRGLEGRGLVLNPMSFMVVRRYSPGPWMVHSRPGLGLGGRGLVLDPGLWMTHSRKG